MNSKPSKRGECSGWSPAVARRNLRFLWSVDTDALEGIGFSFTFTVLDCPEDPQVWSATINRLSVALMRGSKIIPSALRLHWVNEWQKRGVPHLHGVVYFSQDAVAQGGGAEKMKHRISWVWEHVAAKWRPSPKSQFVTPIYDPLGWSKYCAKHAARGARHVQRNRSAMPKAWQGKTGRMWGKSGSWGILQPLKVEFPTAEGFPAFRRLVRSRVVAEARKELAAATAAAQELGVSRWQDVCSDKLLSPGAAPRSTENDLAAHERAQSGSPVGRDSVMCSKVRAALRLRSALRSINYSRRLFRCPDRTLSSLRGVSQWLPADIARAMLRNLTDRGIEWAEALSD